MNLNRLKSIFTLKRIAIFFLSIFLILFFAGGCSFKYMDWQFYKAEKMSDECSGTYIYDKALYEEAQKYGEKMLSNGYPIEREPLLMDTRYSRIKIVGSNIYFVDNNGTKHTIYQIRKYRQRYFKLYISGDEGGGFGLNTWRLYWLPNRHNVFYMKDYINSKKEVCE